jgi:dUTP pyrophosphatase
MNKIEIKFIKLHENALLPSKAHETDTGYDLHCVADTIIEPGRSAVVPVGLQVGYVTPGYWYLVLPKSGLGFKHHLQPHLGVIDQSYTGSLDIKMYNFGNTSYTFKVGNKVAQIAFFPVLSPAVGWTSTVSDTDRGSNGFGSSGV